MPTSSETITIEQLADHGNRESLWIAVHDHVYDLTKFASAHPGGIDVLVDCAGADGTEAFDYASHSELNKTKLQRYRVGQLTKNENSPQASFAPQSPIHSSMVKRKDTRNVGSVAKQWALSRGITGMTVVLVIPLLVALAYQLEEMEDLGFSIRSRLSSGLRASQDVGQSFWTGVAVASSISCVALGYLYKLFSYSLDYQNDVFSFPPTIPRKTKR